MERFIFITAFFVIPLLVWGSTLSHRRDMAERHHASHDTFTVPSRAISQIINLIYIGAALAILLGLLAQFHVIRTNDHLVYGGLFVFELALVAVWAMESRFRVRVYSDHLTFVPLIGREIHIPYAAIDSMDFGLGGSLRIWIRGENRLVILPILDTYQIRQWVDRARREANPMVEEPVPVRTVA